MSIKRFLALLGKDDPGQSGATTVEFVILFPVFVSTIFWIMEVGFLNVKALQLDRGLEFAVRDVMTNDAVTDMTEEEAHEHLKSIVCDKTVIADCGDLLKIELSTVNDYADFGDSVGACRDRAIELDPVLSLTYTPDYNLNPGSCTESLVLVEVQACLLAETILPPFFSRIGTKGGDDGYFEIRSISALLNEPC